MTGRLDELLRDARVPGEAEAEQRSWSVVRAAYDEPGAPRRRRRPVARAVLVVAACLTVTVVALTPPGPALARWIKRATGLDGGVPHARHALSRLPAAGSLLTAGPEGAAIVHADGSRRFLGPYREASWSPQGRFVVVVRGRQLVAVDPVGKVRWAITPPGRPSDPRWSPDGFRIAYRSAGTLRVVAGDGTGDRLLASHARPGTLAWRPRRPHTLGWADNHGRLVVGNVDGRKRLRSALGGIRVPVATRAFAWSADGSRVYALTPDDLRTWKVDAGRVRRAPLGAGSIGVDLAAAPDSRHVAVLEWNAARTRSEIVLVGRGGLPRRGRRLFGTAGRLTSVEWSPDSRWVLATWRDADQWVFVRAARQAADQSPGRRRRAARPVSARTRQLPPHRGLVLHSVAGANSPAG